MHSWLRLQGGSFTKHFRSTYLPTEAMPPQGHLPQSLLGQYPKESLSPSSTHLVCSATCAGPKQSNMLGLQLRLNIDLETVSKYLPFARPSASSAL